MKTVGILQPGKLGDIIICLPIAKYWKEKGYKVVWPIFENFVPMFQKAIDYVTFIPVTNDVYQCVPQARALLEAYNILEILDLAATFPGSKCTDEYVKLGDGFGPEKFDAFKYRLAQVPFDLKWKLEYKRDFEKERELYATYVGSILDYDIIGVKHSRGVVNVKFESKNKLIEVKDFHSIFDWRIILEEAQCIALVDSAMANFVEQLNLPNKKIIIRKPGHPTPTFKNNWIEK